MENTNTQKSWINIIRNIEEKNVIGYILLDENYEKIDTVPGLKTTLFPHQKTIVKAMIDLETYNSVKIETSYNSYECNTSAGILSEAVGSGKTIDILSVILLQKTLIAKPCISELKLYEYSNKNTNKTIFSSIVKKTYNNIIKPTIIFASVSVVNQWVNAINTFTSLKYFTVSDIKSLQHLINKMVDGTINLYDIIVVKSGKVTRPVIFPTWIRSDDVCLYKSSIHIYSIIANMRSFCWNRIIIDDFDTIKIPNNAGCINGIFTWYISSTQKITPYRSLTSKFKTTSEMLLHSNYNCCNIINNNILSDCLNIRNDSQFVMQTANISSPNFYAYVFPNYNNMYIGLLGLINDDESKEIMEMLNGDAIETAAELIGIKNITAADIFQNMLGKQYTKYKKSIEVLSFIDQVEKLKDTRLPMSENPDESDTYKKTDLFIKRPIVYNYPNIKHILDSTYEEYTDIKKKTGISIDRVKNNIKNGECAICSNDLNDCDEDTLILKCCGNIVCGICCFGTIFPKKSKTGRCSNCRSEINWSNLIYLNSSFDLSTVVNEQIDNVNDEKSNNKNRNKMNAIIEIITGKSPVEKKKIDININNLMKGTHVLPESDYRKVLIFANFDETLKNIEEALLNENIEFMRLGGNHSKINKLVELFTNCKKSCVMIINSMKHCAGLNLQTTTDLIFAHKIIDSNVETQVIGRGHRLGRSTSLNIHYLMYENEYDYMVNSNSIRII